MRIYLSGKMTGCPDHNRPAFEDAAKRLREQGHFVINPADLSTMFGSAEDVVESFKSLYGISTTSLSKTIGGFGLSGWEKFIEKSIASSSRLAESVMSADLAAVCSCDAIYLLKGWEKSRGAKKELAEAIAHGLTIMQEGADA